MRRFGFAVFLTSALMSVGSLKAQSTYLVDGRPCPDQDPGRRPPGPNEWCDYVTKIQSCKGDLAERVFRQGRQPGDLLSEVGTTHPRRLACHAATDSGG